jgi:hypothetical protein
LCQMLRKLANHQIDINRKQRQNHQLST